MLEIICTLIWNTFKHLAVPYCTFIHKNNPDFIIFLLSYFEHQTETKNNGIGILLNVIYYWSPSPTGRTLCWAHLVSPCRTEASYMTLFLALSWYFYASLTSCSRTHAVCVSPLLTFWWYAHTHTQLTWRTRSYTDNQTALLPFMFDCQTHYLLTTQSLYIYI